MVIHREADEVVVDLEVLRISLQMETKKEDREATLLTENDHQQLKKKEIGEEIVKNHILLIAETRETQRTEEDHLQENEQTEKRDLW